MSSMNNRIQLYSTIENITYWSSKSVWRYLLPSIVLYFAADDCSDHRFNQTKLNLGCKVMQGGSVVTSRRTTSLAKHVTHSSSSQQQWHSSILWCDNAHTCTWNRKAYIEPSLVLMKETIISYKIHRIRTCTCPLLRLHLSLFCNSLRFDLALSLSWLYSLSQSSSAIGSSPSLLSPCSSLEWLSSEDEPCWSSNMNGWMWFCESILKSESESSLSPVSVQLLLLSASYLSDIFV